MKNINSLLNSKSIKENNKKRKEDSIENILKGEEMLNLLVVKKKLSLLLLIINYSPNLFLSTKPKNHLFFFF